MERNIEKLSEEQIEQDIEITQKEIEQLQRELDALKGNYEENKLQIYIREGKIHERELFIKDLKFYLEVQNKTKNLK